MNTHLSTNHDIDKRHKHFFSSSRNQNQETNSFQSILHGVQLSNVIVFALCMLDCVTILHIRLFL